MRHIVLFTTGQSSDLNTALELGRRLKLAGHDLSYISPADIGDRVEAENHPFFRLRKDRELLDQLPQIDAHRSLLVRLLERRRLRMRSAENSELDKLLGRLRPDLLLIHPEMHFVIIATAALRIPTLLTMNWFCILPRLGLPTLDTSVVPRPGPIGTVTSMATWLWPPIANRWQRLRRLFSKAGLGRPFRVIAYDSRDFADLRTLANARGYSMTRETTQNAWLTPVVYRNLPILSYNAKEMEFPHRPHRRIHYVGPMVQMDRKEPRFGGEQAAGLRSFLGEPSAGNDPRTSLIYCSLGSYWGLDQRFLRKVIEVFRRRSDWSLVLGLGAKRGADALGEIPANVLVLSWAPQLEILKIADCAITHGGISTVNECIACSVPMLVYSTKHVDQNGTAARVHFHGLGIRADKDQDDSHDIERLLERVLNDRPIRGRLSDMQRRFKDYEESGTAVKVIESYLRKQTRSVHEDDARDQQTNAS